MRTRGKEERECVCVCEREREEAIPKVTDRKKAEIHSEGVREGNTMETYKYICFG